MAEPTAPQLRLALMVIAAIGVIRRHVQRPPVSYLADRPTCDAWEAVVDERLQGLAFADLMSMTMDEAHRSDASALVHGMALAQTFRSVTQPVDPRLDEVAAASILAARVSLERNDPERVGALELVLDVWSMSRPDVRLLASFFAQAVAATTALEPSQQDLRSVSSALSKGLPGLVAIRGVRATEHPSAARSAVVGRLVRGLPDVGAKGLELGLLPHSKSRA